MNRVYFTIVFKFLVLLTAKGQMPNASDNVLIRYIAPAPESIFKRFREAGMDPANHPLKEVEIAKVEAAISVLPPLHQKILSTHIYVLLHELTHVVDAILDLTPSIENATDSVVPTVITKGIWHKMNVPINTYIDSLVEKTIFRGGGRIPITSAPELYRALSKMPFVSLYATASWSEDIAELETIYHLTHKMKQPFNIIIKKGKDELARFEPMESKLVKKRLHQLKMFYQ